MRFNAWQFRQILARGVHGILLCQAETAGRGAGLRRVLPLSAPERPGSTRRCRPRSRDWRGADRPAGATARPAVDGAGRAALLGLGTRGRGSEPTRRRRLGARRRRSTSTRCDPWPLNPRRRAAAGGQAREPGGRGQLRGDPGRARPRLRRAGPGRPRPLARLRAACRATRIRRRCARPRERVFAACRANGIAFLEGARADNDRRPDRRGRAGDRRPPRGDGEDRPGALPARPAGLSRRLQEDTLRLRAGRVRAMTETTQTTGRAAVPRRVLVTGSTGAIGQPLGRYLRGARAHRARLRPAARRRAWRTTSPATSTTATPCAGR